MSDCVPVSDPFGGACCKERKSDGGGAVCNELVAFAKTKELQSGESQTVNIDVDLYTLASFNEVVDQWETAAGNYTVKFGANVEDIRCSAPFKLAKEQTWKALDILKPEKEIKEIAVK